MVTCSLLSFKTASKIFETQGGNSGVCEYLQSSMSDIWLYREINVLFIHEARCDGGSPDANFLCMPCQGFQP